ncbi:hypothetical protein TcCL_NonESM13407 [Trypanosoma cruzi]|nr:hypothetical protein TcCL_NonESM13407 [Trypanosoma cruzi]
MNTKKIEKSKKKASDSAWNAAHISPVGNHTSALLCSEYRRNSKQSQMQKRQWSLHPPSDDVRLASTVRVGGCLSAVDKGPSPVFVGVLARQKRLIEDKFPVFCSITCSVVNRAARQRQIAENHNKFLFP